jgi:hypothetical protein
MENFVSTAENASFDKRDFLVKIFGWNILAFLAAFLINNFLTVVYGFPGALYFLSKPSFNSTIQVGVYVISVSIFSYFALLRSQRSLRQDADAIHKFNVFIVRWFFSDHSGGWYRRRQHRFSASGKSPSLVCQQYSGKQS